MARSFPANFDLRLLGGPRAKQFAKPEDAFQQLIGDGLKEMAGPYAHISPTRGRDGSIDAFLIDGATLAGPFQDLPLPLIVECKTHDDAAKGINRNILGQWALMERKLEAQALDGWKDLFEPWLEARGYTYCVSAQIPAEQVRKQLSSAIEAFFLSLPLDGRPAIDRIRVIDWSDLRPWLNASPRISDSWLGIELELILDHDTHLNRLSGFRQYLLPSQLEFVPPPEESSFHPTRILAEIDGVDTKHVLLVGAGGIGKTRTAIEVGTLAVNTGWRVLHILPDEPGVETEDIAEIVLPYNNGRTLLIFDYIDQMQRLDLGGIRRSLIPAAAERGIHLRLLANCRPGWMEIANPERDELFRVIELRPTEAHKATLIETMATRIAPTASGMLGKKEVIRLCGTRAIIALLIARELENRALAGLLIDIDITKLRDGDLVQWLRRRLEENALSVKHDEPSLVPQRPAVPMVAAAAALACAPETRDTLILASESAYRDLEWPTAHEDARFLVDLLLRFGWLEPHGIFDSTPHDVVADEVLDQTIHSDAIIFEKELTAVLSCSLSIPRGIGRLATALRRVFGTVKAEGFAQSITEFLNVWFSANATALGDVLKTGDPDLTGYALGALLSGPPLEESAMAEWDSVFLPWLSAHSEKEEARHLLYKGLKGVESDQNLVPPALAWLNIHNLAVSATFVLSPLLDRDDLSAAEAARVSQFSLQWLKLYHQIPEAEFVLHPLLGRTDLEGDEATKARATALEWLELHHDTLEAKFVLQPLLERTDLEGDEATKARATALEWLEPHHDTLDAEFVLKPLLERIDLESGEATKAHAFAMQWLETHHDALDAGFILKPLLERADLKGDEATKARAFALQWLETHHATIDAGFVLPQLLDQIEVGNQRAAPVVETAIIWLQSFHGTTGAAFVLLKLFRRSDVPESDRLSLLAAAIQTLRKHLGDDESRFLLRSCLQYRINNDPLQRQLVSLAQQWLELHPGNSDAEYIWNRILRYRPNLITDQDWSAVARQAVSWLKNKGLKDAGVEQTTNSVLMRPHCLPVADRDAVVRFALRLLETTLHPKGRTKLVASLEYLVRSLPDHDPLRDEISRSLINS